MTTTMVDEVDFSLEIQAIWEQAKPTLEKMWDKWSDRWEHRPPRTLYKIRARKDVEIDGVMVMANKPIHCHLCGQNDHWLHLEGAQHGEVYVCEHRPQELGLLYWLPCRVVSTIPGELVGWATPLHDERDI